MKKSKLRSALILAVIITILIPFFDINHAKASETNLSETDSNIAWAVSANGFDIYTKWLEENNYNNEIRIAIMTTGINKDHEIFDGRLLYLEDLNSNARNNYIGAEGSSNDQNKSDLTDNTGLGTAIAGLIAESTPSNVKIIPVKITEDDNGFTLERGVDIYKAFHDITKYGDPDVIYCPFFIEYSKFDDYGGFMEGNIKGYINEKLAESNKNLMLISTSGEAGDEKVFPKDIDELLSASALGEDGKITATSGRGSSIDYALPSKNLKVPSHIGKNTYEVRSGANLAGALLTSAVALAKLEHPDYTSSQISEFLNENAEDLGEEGKDNLYGYGEINFNYKMFQDYHVQVANMTRNKATIKIDEQNVSNEYITEFNSRDTEKTFTVSCNNACIASVSYDGGETYKLLKAIATGEENTYSYTINLKSGNDIKIAVAIKGDVNFNGSVNVLDVKAVRKVAKLGDSGLNALEKVFYNVNGSGGINVLDVKALRKEAMLSNSLTW